jgi:hypothetical protein
MIRKLALTLWMTLSAFAFAAAPMDDANVLHVGQ